MAHRYEPSLENPAVIDLVIDGWEQGISDSPEFGLADMRNVNNDSIPGVALCNYQLVATTQIQASANISSSDAAADTVTLTNPITYGMPITFANTNSGVTAGTIYYATGNPSSTSAKSGIITQLTATVQPQNPTSFLSNSIVDITGNMAGINTYSIPAMGTPKSYATDYGRNGLSGNYYVLDSSQQVWVNIVSGASSNGTNSVNPLFTLVKGNPSSGTGNGIGFYNKYLFVFGSTAIDIYDAYGQESGGTTNSWKTAAWQTNLSSNVHPAHLSLTEQVLYYGDGNKVGSISTDGTVPPLIANFVQTTAALKLSNFEIVSAMEEPSIDTGNGTLMYIGTSTSERIYPWDKHSTGTLAPLVSPEIGCYQMLNINKIVYILMGKRGNVYWTNGSSVMHFSRVPYQPTKTPYPNITWGGIMSLNNNLCFGAADASNNASGCYAITLSISQYGNLVAGAIRYKGQPSGGTYNTTVLIPTLDGLTYYAGWFNGVNGGIDILDTATPSFYSNYESYIESEIIPVGTAFQPKTFTTIECKLDTPLISGDSIKISMRSSLNPTAYSEVFTLSTVGAVDGNSNNDASLIPARTGIPIQLGKWVQIKAALQTVSGGSFTRLKEIRLR